MTEIDKARAYVTEAIASFDGDPADSDFQDGYLAALYVVGREALGMEIEEPSQLPHPQAPNTLSEVEEAKARLAELDCLDGSPASHVERLRCRASAWAFAGNVLKAKQADAEADRIEAALATLRASQEQDGEVRT